MRKDILQGAFVLTPFGSQISLRRRYYSIPIAQINRTEVNYPQGHTPVKRSKARPRGAGGAEGRAGAGGGA